MTIRLGMLTPSSNTVLEPTTARILAGLPDVSVHFSRFRVTEIGLDAAANDQFDERPMLAAAGLLADAKVDVISWNGTSAGWLGLDSDRRLCARVVETTGVKASTSVLALFGILRQRGEARVGLVTPYTSDVQQAIVAGFAREGVTTVSERHTGLRDNFSFAEVSAADLAGIIEAVAADRPDAIVVLCTNSPPLRSWRISRPGSTCPSTTASRRRCMARSPQLASTQRRSRDSGGCSPRLWPNSPLQIRRGAAAAESQLWLP